MVNQTKPDDKPSCGHIGLDNTDVIVSTLGPYGRRGKIGILVLAIITGWAFIAYIYQLRRGLAVTAMSDYFCWGVYIINFVFFIGISMAGTLISAILRLTGADWRRPITRMAEGITLFSLLIAGPMVIIDMGRPDKFFHVFSYGRLQSPILWDVLSLTTYLAGSILYLYLPLIPDLAMLRDSKQKFSNWRKWLYRKLSLGWQGTAGAVPAAESGNLDYGSDYYSGSYFHSYGDSLDFRNDAASGMAQHDYRAGFCCRGTIFGYCRRHYHNGYFPQGISS